MPRLFTTGGLCYAALSLLLLGGGHEGGPLRPAAGHAVMVEPRSRPWMEYLQNYNYLPHQVRVSVCMECVSGHTRPGCSGVGQMLRIR